jgi:hypothetical protein
MANKPSKWSQYLDRIIQILEATQYNASPLKVAYQIDKEEDLDLSEKDIDLLRTYIKRKQQKLRVKSGLTKNRVYIGGHDVSGAVNDEKKSWEESDDSAIYEYKGERSIKTLEDALEFSEVDLNIWEVERHIFNSWDVSMKNEDGSGAFKRTNYQVKVWFRRKEDLNITRPKYRHIEVEKNKESQMWIIIGCVHRPFHDKALWDKFLNFIEDNRRNITGIIIDGDYLDLRSLSSHEEWIPEGVDLSYEYSDGLQGIEDIESRLRKSVRKIFIYGKDEDRFFRDKKSIRKYGSSLPAPHEALELDKRGWEIITDWKNGYVTLGNKLDIFHGTKVGKNAAKDQLDAIPNRSHVFFHTHRYGSASNQTNSATNGGCMIDFESDMFKYVDRGTREGWAQGFVVAYIDDKGNEHVYPIKVDKNKGFFFKGDAY